MPFSTTTRRELEKLMGEELAMVKQKANMIAGDMWAGADVAVSRELGYGDTVLRIEHVKNQIAGLQQELNELEGGVQERAQPASALNYSEAALVVDFNQYGRPYHVPRIFGHAISTKWDCLILKYLNSKIPFFHVYNTLESLHHTVKRELLLCSNVEDARALYMKFHYKIKEAVGDELPPMISEVRDVPALNEYEPS